MNKADRKENFFYAKREMDMLNKLKYKICNILNEMFPAEPEFDINHPRSETINHKDFINQDETVKEKILYQMAEGHYNADLGC